MGPALPRHRHHGGARGPHQLQRCSAPVCAGRQRAPRSGARFSGRRMGRPQRLRLLSRERARPSARRTRAANRSIHPARTGRRTAGAAPLSTTRGGMPRATKFVGARMSPIGRGDVIRVVGRGRRWRATRAARERAPRSRRCDDRAATRRRQPIWPETTAVGPHGARRHTASAARPAKGERSCERTCERSRLRPGCSWSCR